MLSPGRGWRPRFSLGMQLVLFAALVLMTLPWLGLRYMEEMKEFLVQGQGDAQLLTAQAIATVLHNRSDLFNVSGLPNSPLVDANALYAFQLDEKITLDGYASDWKSLLAQQRHFGAESVIYDRTAGAVAPVSFGLLLGEYRDNLFGYLSVRDRHVVERDPSYASLNRSDFLRLEITGEGGDAQRYLLLLEQRGKVSVYEMQPDWARVTTGQPLYTLNAVWRASQDGYTLEFRLPKGWLEGGRYLMISVADVNSEVERRVDTVTATLSRSSADYLNKLIIRSPQLDRILQGLGYADSNVCIIDQFRRVRALLGSNVSRSELCSMTDRVAPELVSKALAGKSDVYRNYLEDDGALVIASNPIYQDGDVIGVVLVEKNSHNILSRQRETLDKVMRSTIAVFAAVLAGLLLFSMWLAYRIKSLQRELTSAIDEDGRLVRPTLKASSRAGDELGELSRGIALLLSQLHNYTGFLESVPRTLRHEILNPLNTISMSLQAMRRGGHYDKTAVEGAVKAAQQLELIVCSLTEAAHIDDALAQAEREPFDLAQLLGEYVANIRRKHTNSHFRYRGPQEGVWVNGNDLRLTQLLDKIKDNAVDFAEADSSIEFSLQFADTGEAILAVCNHGPLIPEAILSNLTSGILSHRHGTAETPHLGIGLYVASRIAKFHNGRLTVVNREAGDGVCVQLTLPTR